MKERLTRRQFLQNIGVGTEEFAGGFAIKPVSPNLSEAAIISGLTTLGIFNEKNAVRDGIICGIIFEAIIQGVDRLREK
ncbi:hypothetical protein C4559_04465 [Candidatus Microgenomates bacterium]|nr:MAG: hypothetical protein C4559_04465 [Candidatus Microgenomates bacterium]